MRCILVRAFFFRFRITLFVRLPDPSGKVNITRSPRKVKVILVFPRLFGAFRLISVFRHSFNMQISIISGTACLSEAEDKSVLKESPNRMIFPDIVSCYSDLGEEQHYGFRLRIMLISAPKESALFFSLPYNAEYADLRKQHYSAPKKVMLISTFAKSALFSAQKGNADLSFLEISIILRPKK